MRALFFLILVGFSINLTYGATIKVAPFELRFLVDTNLYDVDFKLKMQCRYEKIVFGDSSEYEYKYKDVALKVSKKKINNELTEVTVSNNFEANLSQTTWYRSNKKCGYIQHFYLKSKLYSIGWANQFDREIKLGLYKHSNMKESAVFPIKELKDRIGNKELGFNYNAVANQVNIKFSIDRVSVPEIGGYLGTTAYKNPETNMPWPLKK